MSFQIHAPSAHHYPHPSVIAGLEVPLSASFPEVWRVTPECAPFQLAVTSWLCRGPAPRRAGFSYLQLGCGAGAHLLAAAFYQPDARFFGIDTDAAAIAAARAHAQALALTNVTFEHVSSCDALSFTDSFDYIVVLDTLSWCGEGLLGRLIPRLTKHLTPAGLLCLHYDTVPGWNIRESTLLRLIDALPRRAPLPLLIAATRSAAEALLVRTAAVARAGTVDLVRAELAFIAAADADQIYRYYLLPTPTPLRIQEVAAHALSAGLRYVADAADLRPWAVVPQTLPVALPPSDITGIAALQMHDTFSFRRTRLSCFCRQDASPAPPVAELFASVAVASRAERSGPVFRLATGHTIQSDVAWQNDLLDALVAASPTGVRFADLAGQRAPDAALLCDTLTDLCKSGFAELRPILLPPSSPKRVHRLAAYESQRGRAPTSAWLEPVPVSLALSDVDAVSRFGLLAF